VLEMALERKPEPLPEKDDVSTPPPVEQATTVAIKH